MGPVPGHPPPPPTQNGTNLALLPPPQNLIPRPRLSPSSPSLGGVLRLAGLNYFFLHEIRESQVRAFRPTRPGSTLLARTRKRPLLKFSIFQRSPPSGIPTSFR